MFFVSACLMGENCKYSGGNNLNEDVVAFLDGKEYILVCPEVAGGLKCPRSPAERCGERVIDQDGVDVTDAFLKGAKMTLDLALEHKPELCILKANSPSCGYGTIYDGTFSGNKVLGNGVTVDLLLNHGFKVISEKSLKKD